MLSEQERKERLEKIITDAAKDAAIWAAVPVPFVHLAALKKKQIAMMERICDVYGYNVSTDELDLLTSAAMGANATDSTWKVFVGEFLKLISGGAVTAVGGSVISEKMASSITQTIGKAFTQVCDAAENGTISDITSSQGRDLMRERVMGITKKMGENI